MHLPWDFNHSGDDDPTYSPNILAVASKAALFGAKNVYSACFQGLYTYIDARYVIIDDDEAMMR